MTTYAKFRKFSLLLAATMILSVVAIAQSAESQPANSSDQNPPAQKTATPASVEPHETSGDENEAFKHSGSVKFLAKITGLSVDGAYWLAVILNFALVAGVIVWFSKKNLPAVFRSRTATIQKSLAEARAASEDANRRLAEIESRLGRMGEEISQMQATAETSAAAEEEGIKASAAEDARRIIEQAQQEIEAAAKAARRDLTAHAADLAVTLAARQITVDAPTDQALIRRFAKDLASDGGPGKKN